MKRITLIIISIVACIVVSSCDTRRTIYPESGVWVIVDLDWSNLESNTNGATVAFYPQTRAELTPSYLYTNYQRDSIYLTKDIYYVVAMNETTSSHTNLTFSNKGVFDSFVANIDNVSVTPSTDSGSITVGGEPDILTIEQLLDLEITRESVIENTRYYIDFTPKQVTKNLQVTLYLDGISNLGSGTNSVVIDGMSKGVMLGNSEYSSEQTSHYIAFTNGSVDENGEVGYLRGDVNCFGEADGATNTVKIRLSLRDGSTYELDYDATGKIYVDEDNELQLYLDIYDEVGIPGGGEDEEDETDKPGITVPEVDDNEDDTDGNSGFGANVDDWGDVENVPVTAK